MLYLVANTLVTTRQKLSGGGGIRTRVLKGLENSSYMLSPMFSFSLEAPKDRIL